MPKFFKICSLFIYLVAAGLSCSTQDLGCSIWDLAPLPRIKPRPSALGAQSLNNWTTREAPKMPNFN